MSLSISTSFAAHLVAHPDKLQLSGRDPVHGVIVSLVHDDGSMEDVTQRVSFETDAPGLVSVDRHGLVTAQTDGTVNLIIRFETHELSVPVVVAGLQDKPTPSFKQDVLPSLTRSGCNTGACHGKLSGQNGFRLSLRGYAPEWDHGWMTQEVSGRRIDFGFPLKASC